MHKRILAILAPPIAIGKYGGAAAWCAAPIGVAWISALVGIAIGLRGEAEGMSTMWWSVALGCAIWALAAVWAEAVITGIDHDAAHLADSTRDHTVAPTDDEIDPLEQLRQAR